MDQISVKKARIGMEKKILQEEDIISSLPDHILHEIMSLLPSRYAAMTSVLSHRWLKIWFTFPSIRLDETKFRDREQFLHCLRATFARCNLLNLQKLRLQRLRAGSLELYQLINKFMDVVLSQGALAILEITFVDYVHLRYEELYVLPKEMFSLCSSLIALRIEGCRFEGCEPVNLPSLKTLLMKNVIFENQDFLQELTQGCPVLENLSMKYCNGIKNLRVLHPTLQRFVLGFYGEMESLELDVPCVKSIKFKALDHFYDELTQVLSYVKIRARNVQTLRLKHFTMGSEMLHNMISIFPKIKKLNMRYCQVLGNVEVLSNTLTTLRMTECIFQEEVEIKASNLQAITYLHNSRGPQLDNTIFMHLTRIFLANVQVSWILCINDSTCPNLESLDLISCENMKQLRIVSSRLQSLNVFECEDLEFFMIAALQLSYFSYSGQVVRTYQIVASINLQAKLHLKGPQGYHDHGETELHKFTKFLHNFDVSAKAMTIRLTCDCAMCLLMMKDVHVPPLSYLLHLKIETRSQVIRLVDVLRCALRVSVCYNALSMDVGVFSMTLQFQEIDKEETCLRKMNNHACIEEHLLGVDIINFRGSDEEVELVGFFTRNAKQMKHMTIWTTQRCLNAFQWTHRLPCLLQQFDVLSQGSYALFSRRAI